MRISYQPRPRLVVYGYIAVDMYSNEPLYWPKRSNDPWMFALEQRFLMLAWERSFCTSVMAIRHVIDGEGLTKKLFLPGTIQLRLAFCCTAMALNQ